MAPATSWLLLLMLLLLLTFELSLLKSMFVLAGLAAKFHSSFLYHQPYRERKRKGGKEKRK